MTTEERFDRIEHLAAGLVEEHRKDREENRQLWRQTQEQLQRLITDVDRTILQVAETAATIRMLAEESRAADRRLETRIDAMISAMGEFISRQSR